MMHQYSWGVGTPHELTIVANISYDGGRRKVAMSRKLKNMPGYEFITYPNCAS